jgi:poly(glycerol-phosphate) alpha-glucosyltransferase
LSFNIVKNRLSILYFIDDLDNKKSGIYSSLQQTTSILKKNGSNVTVLGMGNLIKSQQTEWLVKTIPFKSFGPKSLNYLLGLDDWLKKNLSNYDIVGIHSLWSFSASILVKYCLLYNIPFVVTTHGMLHPEALKISKWKKILAKKILLSKLFKKAACFQALNYSEYLYIKKFGVKVPISIIGNGIQIIITKSLINNFDLPINFEKFNICLYLGRLHPIKGVDRLIDSWLSIKIPSNWILVIAGSGDSNYESELIAMTKNYKNSNIYFVGFVEGDEKHYLYNMSSFTVLPSHSEAFPMSVLESFAHKKPVLITNACEFDDAINANAAITVESSKEGIAIGLQILINLNESDLIKMGQNGFNLAEKNYSWDKIHTNLIEMYNWIIFREVQPNFIFK